MKFARLVRYVGRRPAHPVADLSDGAGSAQGYAVGGGPGPAVGDAYCLVAGREPPVSRTRTNRLFSDRHRCRTRVGGIIRNWMDRTLSRDFRATGSFEASRRADARVERMATSTARFAVAISWKRAGKSLTPLARAIVTRGSSSRNDPRGYGARLAGLDLE